MNKVLFSINPLNVVIINCQKLGYGIVILHFVIWTVFVISCTKQEGGIEKMASRKSLEHLKDIPFLPEWNAQSQIGKFIVEIFEDTKGNLWIGTMTKGVARYNGQELEYFSIEHGLSDDSVVSMVEDKRGNIWLGTHTGLSKYSRDTFTNYKHDEALCHERISKLMLDQQGQLWVGTWNGVCWYDGKKFHDFPLPKPEVQLLSYQSTMNWVTDIIEDRKGNIWFARDGYGVCCYDGKAFKHFTQKDGLASNNVQTILEDKNGHFWFGSRVAEKDNVDPKGRNGLGGLSYFDGQTIHQFPEINGLYKNDIYALCQDKAGNIWIGTNGLGVYRYDGLNFTLYSNTDRADLIPNYGIQSILEDLNGGLWLGFSGGLFRLKGTSLVNVAQTGPWK